MPSPLTPEEIRQRKKQVQKWVLLRAFLLGALVAAWWILFVPESVVTDDLKYPLGILAGFIACAFYLFNLRETFTGAAAKE